MLSHTFTITPNTKDNLGKIDQLKIQILTSPINPLKKNHLLWQNSLTKIYSSMSLSKHNVSFKGISNSIIKPNSDPTSKLSKSLKSTLDSMYFIWTNNPDSLTTKHLKDIYKNLSFGLAEKPAFRNKATYLSDINSETKSPTDPDQIDTLMRSLTTEINNPTGQHPAITAALSLAQIARISPFQHHNHLYAHIVGNLVLAKNNLAADGLINLESIFIQDKEKYLTLIKECLTPHTDLKQWISFYTSSLIKAQEAAVNQMSLFSQNSANILSKNALLNARQLKIISMITDPNSKISNIDLVKTFKISTITAARDLTKLKNLGMIFQIGGGRSTSYSINPVEDYLS